VAAPEEPALLASLRRAVADNGDDVPLRVHLAGLLLDADLGEEAVGHLAEALSREPAHPAARAS
jgi:thioredoxin-like negative regulator of GroEL